MNTPSRTYATGIAALMVRRLVAAKIAAAALFRGLAIPLVVLRSGLLRLAFIGLVVPTSGLRQTVGSLAVTPAAPRRRAIKTGYRRVLVGLTTFSTSYQIPCLFGLCPDNKSTLWC